MRSGIYEFQSDFARSHIARGVVEAQVRSLLAVPETVKARIEGCTDVDQLEHLTRRAVTVASAEELFD